MQMTAAVQGAVCGEETDIRIQTLTRLFVYIIRFYIIYQHEQQNQRQIFSSLFQMLLEST